MSFSDLEYGWITERFQLKNVSLNSEVQLDQLGKDGDLVERSALYVS